MQRRAIDETGEAQERKKKKTPSRLPAADPRRNRPFVDAIVEIVMTIALEVGEGGERGGRGHPRNRQRNLGKSRKL
jgi:hypothetical protein